MNGVTSVLKRLPADWESRSLSVLDPIDHSRALRKTIRLATMLAGGFLLALLIAATLVRVAGAVVAPGEVSVKSKVKKIAHPSGGVVSAILVHDGDHVRKGQVLMRLDSKVSSVSASTSGESLEQLLARRARLKAEQEGAASVTFPVELLTSTSATVRMAMADEQRQFQLRRVSRGGQRAQLDERIRQMEQQIRGYGMQIGATRDQQQLITPELEGLRTLWQRKLVPINRLNSLERTAIDLRANAASLSSEIARTRAQVAEIRAQSLQLDQAARTDAGTELGTVEQQIADQRIRATSSADSFDRSTIRAPYDGIVDRLAYTTVGGVLPPAETIMDIVPDKDPLIVEAKVRPSDIDQVAVGRHVTLHFTAFSAQTTPTIDGTLRRVSADRVTDPRTGAEYFTVTVTVNADQTKRLAGLVLVPGMPVDAMIQTGSRSLMSYIMKPFHDQLDRAFREG